MEHFSSFIKCNQGIFFFQQMVVDTVQGVPYEGRRLDTKKVRKNWFPGTRNHIAGKIPIGQVSKDHVQCEALPVVLLHIPVCLYSQTCWPITSCWGWEEEQLCINKFMSVVFC